MNFNWKIILFLICIFLLSLNITWANDSNQTILTNESMESSNSNGVVENLSVKYVENEHPNSNGVTATFHIENTGNVDLNDVFIIIDYDSRAKFFKHDFYKINIAHNNNPDGFNIVSNIWKFTKTDNKLFFNLTRPLKVNESMYLFLVFDGYDAFDHPFRISLIAGFNNTIVCNDTRFIYVKSFLEIPWRPPWTLPQLHLVEENKTMQKKQLQLHNNVVGNPIHLLLLNSILAMAFLFKRRI